MKKADVSNEVVNEVVKMNQTMSITKIADKMNLSTYMVKTLITDAGIKPNVCAMDFIDHDEVVYLYEEGFGVDEICNRVKHSPLVIIEILNLNGKNIPLNGNPKTKIDQKVRSAMSRNKVYDSEEKFANMLSTLELEVDHQSVVEYYNIDLMINDSVAVEVQNGIMNKASIALQPRRTRSILQSEKDLIVVMYDRKGNVHPDAAAKVKVIVDVRRESEPHSKFNYYVISPLGELLFFGDASDSDEVIEHAFRQGKNISVRKCNLVNS